MPGGDPLTWSMADLECAVRVRNKEREFMINLFHYMTFWIVNAVKPGAIQLMDLEPENFMAYVKQMKSMPPKPKQEADPEKQKEFARKADLQLYQNYHKRKARQKK